MAGIITNVGDDIRSLQKLRQEIENVKKALGSIDINVKIDIHKDLEQKLQALTRQYDTLVSKAAEADAKLLESAKRIDKAVDDITAAQEKAAKQTDTTISKEQTTAVEGQAKAYLDLKDEIDSILGTREQNIRQLLNEQNAIRIINAEIAQINKSRQYGRGLTSAQMQRLQQLNDSLLTHKQAIAEVRQELNNNAKMGIAAVGSMNELSQSLSRMRAAYRALNEEERNSPFGQNLLKSIKDADTKIKELDAAIGNHQRNVGNYQGRFNGLNMSVQQIVRELPSATMGINMFFMAISNNVPIMADQIKYAKELNKEMKAAGNEPVPVWKQLVSSMFSWQTAMMVGITLLTVYGKDIANWVKSLFSANDAQEQAKKEAVEFSKIIKKSHDEWRNSVAQTASQQITSYRKMQREWESLGNNLDKKRKFVDSNKTAFNQLGFAVNSVSDAERVMSGNTDAVVQSIMARAKAAAYYAQMQAATERYIKQTEYNKGTLKGGGYYETIKAGKTFLSTGVVPKELQGLRKGIDYTTTFTNSVTQFELTAKGASKINAKRSHAANERLVTNQKKAKEQLDKQIKSLQGGLETVTKENKDLLKKIGVSEYKDYKETNPVKNSKANLMNVDYNKLASERSDLERELANKSSQVYIDSLQNGYEKEKKQRELNHKKELDDLEKYKRDFLQKKISDAKQIFDADPKNKGKSFDPLSVSLSDDENKRFDDMRKNIIKKQENEDKELQKKRADSFNSYLKLYGDMQERRLAIAKEYDEKIAKSQTEGERLSLKAEKMKALSDFDLKDMKESMNWEELFGELGNLSVRQLEGIKAKLREILQSDGLSVEDYKTTVEQIDRVNSAIIDEQDKQRSFFKFTTDYAKERRKLELDVADALKTQSGLLEKQKTLSNDVRAKKDKIWLMLSTMGVSYRGGIDISKNNDILDSVGKKYGVNSKQYKEVQEALDGLAGSTIKLNETNKKKLDADGKAITAQLRLAKLIEDFTSWLSGFIQGFEKINANIQELPELLEKLGVDGESDVGLAVQSFANASNNALGAMKDFESGNYIGAVSKGISAIGDFVDGSISLFAGHGNEKAMEEEIARLSSANKELSYSIDKLSEQIIKKDNTNEQSIDAYKKAVKAQEEWQSNQQKAIDNRAGEWTNTGYGWLKLSGKKSFNYFAKNASSWVWDSMNKALSEQGYTKQITSIGNRDNPNDFWNLSPEEMKAIRTYANEAWRELFSSEGHHNPEELVNEYIERAGSLDKLKDQLNEKLTGFSWEGFRNNYLSVLQDMKSDTNDFAKNINNILSKSILESLVNKKYNQRIKEIQNMVAKAAEDGTITEKEANAIRDANKNLSDDMLRDREQLISKGLLVDEQTKEQSASANGVSSITYEQASNIVALTTAGNISRDQIKDVLLSQKLSSIDLSLTGISLIGKDAVSIADETRTILANSYMELKEINENTGVSAKCLTQIDENIKSMNRLIKDKL